MRILVTGGAGFIGSHICQKLCENRENTIICLDNLSTGSMDNIQHLEGLSNFKFIKEDIEHPFHIADIDQIYNFASPASPIKCQENTISTIRTNVLGTLNVLKLAKKNNAIMFHASTSEVYGDPAVHPQSEDYLGNVNCFGPRSCYNEGKRSAEALCYDYIRNHNTHVRIGRIFNTYGPRMQVDDGRVVSNFVCQSIKGKRITVHGDGSQTRSFCYIDDLVSGVIRLVNYDRYFLSPFNLGNPEEISILQLANVVLDLTQSSTSITYLNRPIDDPNRRCPDVDKIKKAIGWAPTTNLIEGLKNTIRYFERIIDTDESSSLLHGVG